MLPSQIAEAASLVFDVAHKYNWFFFDQKSQPLDGQWHLHEIYEHPLPFDSSAFLAVNPADKDSKVLCTIDKSETDYHIKMWFIRKSQKALIVDFIASSEQKDNFLINYWRPNAFPNYKGNPQLDTAGKAGSMIAMLLSQIHKNKTIVSYKASKQKKAASSRKKKIFLKWNVVRIENKIYERLDHAGGTHASPRWHLRRAHTRRLRSGKIIQVKSHSVGKVSDGISLHHYEMGANSA